MAVWGVAVVLFSRGRWRQDSRIRPTKVRSASAESHRKPESHLDDPLFDRVSQRFAPFESTANLTGQVIPAMLLKRLVLPRSPV